MTESVSYYKVLVDGKSAHGGDYAWSLPHGEKPGQWTPTIAHPRICETGWHLTTAPMRWAKIGMQVYAAQPGAIRDHKGDKIVTTRTRLLREAPEMTPDWWRAVERFVTEEIPAVPWFQPDGDPDPAWKVFT
ncbi:MAG: hypothetical protein LC793_23680, partial [Thermomicrobia bacterium]|nr:hypothetical protein [Thermomicrobia bacterium]